MKRLAFLPFTFLFLVCVLVLQGEKLKAIKGTSPDLTNAELQQRDIREASRLSLIQKSPDFGFENLLADWTFLSFLQYFGDDDLRLQAGYSVSPEFFRVILDRDPYFFYGYVFLSASTSLYAAQPQVTVDLIEEQLPKLTPQTPPEAAVIWRYKGVDELLFLGEPETAKQSYETAAAWAEQSPAPEVQATAEASRQTAEFIAENPYSKSTLAAGWTQILGQAFDEYTFNTAVEQIEALGGTVVRTKNGGISVQIPEKLDEQNP
jgi:hypothetical protein